MYISQLLSEIKLETEALDELILKFTKKNVGPVNSAQCGTSVHLPEASRT